MFIFRFHWKVPAAAVLPHTDAASITSATRYADIRTFMRKFPNPRRSKPMRRPTPMRQLTLFDVAEHGGLQRVRVSDHGVLS